MDAYFAELGRAIGEKWKRENFSLESFPAIAKAALAKRPPTKHVDFSQLMRDFLLNDDQPVQTDSEFGEPEIVVYKHSSFYIQLLFWLDGTTAIHQHEFSGAFHVMQGSSIHARYLFEDARSITPYLRVGKVRMKKMELLEAGRTEPIVSGPGEIHSLFHLDSPSVTVVVRTQHDPGTGPQFNYLPPFLAVDPHHSDLLTMRRTQLLDVLEQAEDPGYAEMVSELIADTDFERGFHLLRHCMDYLQRLGEWPDVANAFEKKHGKSAEDAVVSLHEEVRRAAIKGLRGTITAPEHRFFLALLMNAPTRADLLAMVAKRFPDQSAVETVLRWAAELMEISEEGAGIFDASFPETIDIGADAQLPIFLAALRYFMKPPKKVPPILQGLSTEDMKDLRQAFAESTLFLLVV